ncbi:MAG: radical SAM protein [Candidatus Omnitrophota bacterium]
MRVMLVLPPDVSFVEPFKSSPKKPPLLDWGFPIGLGYIAAVLKQNGFTVSILDSSLFDWRLSMDGLIAEIKRFNPDVVGISCLTHLLKSALELAAKIKQHDKQTKVIFGGPHATYDYAGLLSLDFIDYAVVGEGEYTFLELCEKIKKHESTEDIKGIAYRDGNKRIIKTPGRPLIEDLDSLPFPARELVDFSRYVQYFGILEKNVSIVSSRGCTNRCVFCASAHFFGKWRPRSPENIIAEIKWIFANYPKAASFTFMDDDFTGDRQRTLRFCALLKAAGLHKHRWMCQSRVDQIDEEIAHALRSAGCAMVYLGIESGSPEILKNINKRISLEQARKAVAIIRAAKMDAYAFFMIGHPGETRETIRITRKFVRELKASESGVGIAWVYPGTKLEQLQPVKNWQEYIYTPEVTSPSFFAHPCIPSFLPEGFTREELKAACARFRRGLVPLYFLRRVRDFICRLRVEPKRTLRQFRGLLLTRS